MQAGPVRIAMWSGPRNISTTLMRAWGARPDTFVCDEPFYAHYLLASGVEHPGREEVIAHHDTDWQRVSRWLTGAVPGERAIFYQKHMAKHLLPGMWQPWLEQLTHAFLIREPAGMLASYARVTEAVTLEDTGLPTQRELFDRVADRLGQAPPVIDARDVLLDPPALLQSLCAALDVPFSTQMLAWAPGPRPEDGIWAKYWYGAVLDSTGFGPPTPPAPVPAGMEALHEACLIHYDYLARYRLRSPTDAPDLR